MTERSPGTAESDILARWQRLAGHLCALDEAAEAGDPEALTAAVTAIRAARDSPRLGETPHQSGSPSVARTPTLIAAKSVAESLRNL